MCLLGIHFVDMFAYINEYLDKCTEMVYIIILLYINNIYIHNSSETLLKNRTMIYWIF